MKAGLIIVLFLVLAGSLSGCGQKGPLYLPSPDPAVAEKPADQDSEAERQHTGDL